MLGLYIHQLDQEHPHPCAWKSSHYPEKQTPETLFQVGAMEQTALGHRHKARTYEPDQAEEVLKAGIQDAEEDQPCFG